MQDMQETEVWYLDTEDPLEEEGAAHSSILSGKSYGQRSSVGYSPRNHKTVGRDLVIKTTTTNSLHSILYAYNWSFVLTKHVYPGDINLYIDVLCILFNQFNSGDG